MIKLSISNFERPLLNFFLPQHKLYVFENVPEGCFCNEFFTTGSDRDFLTVVILIQSRC